MCYAVLTSDMRGARTTLRESPCAIARTLDVIGDWSSLLVVRDVFRGKRRFGELEQSLGLAKNILTARLKKLTDEGILERVPASDGSAYQEYVLTPKGEDLHVVLAALWQWGEAHCFGAGETERAMVDAPSGAEVRPIALTTEDGTRVGAREIAWVPKRPRRSAK